MLSDEYGGEDEEDTFSDKEIELFNAKILG